MIKAEDEFVEKELPYGLTMESAVAINDALEQQNYALLKAHLHNLHPADLADFINNTNYEQKIIIVKSIEEELNPLVLVELDKSVKLEIIDIIGFKKFTDFIDKLELDDALYAIEDLDEGSQKEVLALLPKNKRNALEEGLAYPENSAGRMMQKKIVSIPEYWNVGQAIDYLRQHPELPEDFYEIFVIDPKHRPVGGILVSRVMRNQRNVAINDIMQKEIRVIDTNLDQEDVSFIFRQYALVSAPVVNKDGRLVGVISVEDVVDVIEEEAEEDLLKMGGINETDLHSASFKTAKHRFPWLFVNLLTACITSSVINLFQNTIQHIVTLAALMPIVASMGGNAGTQTVTVAVRAIAAKELTYFNTFRVVFKEVISSAINGIGLAIIGGIIVKIWYEDITLSIVFAVAVIINLIFAGFFGAVIPIILNKRGADPAVASSVILTAITDMIGFFAFLGIAHLFLI